MDYLIIVEKTGTGFSAYAPDLPGCIATGKTHDQTRQRMREAVEFHLEGLLLEGYPIPEPTSQAGNWAGAGSSQNPIWAACHPSVESKTPRR